MDEHLINETARLIRAWQYHSREHLEGYLVEDQQDPRINVASILARQFLIEKVFGDLFGGLWEEEVRFGAVMTWLVGRLKGAKDAGLRGRIFDALLDGEDAGGQMGLPSAVSEAFDILPLELGDFVVGNYLNDLLIGMPAVADGDKMPGWLFGEFEKIWAEVLKDRVGERISVIEAACGSANDYRFMDSFGVGRFLEYTGIDLCENNITNARVMYPEVDFRVGNVLQIEAEDDRYDYAVAHDLLEHLSVEAMEASVRELCRVASKGVCVGFFNMHEADEHVVKPYGEYHWNTLSRGLVEKRFGEYFSQVQCVSIDEFVRTRFGGGLTDNPRAYVLFAERGQVIPMGDGFTEPV